MKMLSNEMGVIFDIHSKHELVFDRLSGELQKRGLKVYKADELPELQEE